MDGFDANRPTPLVNIWSTNGGWKMWPSPFVGIDPAVFSPEQNQKPSHWLSMGDPKGVGFDIILKYLIIWFVLGRFIDLSQRIGYISAPINKKVSEGALLGFVQEA